MTPDFPLPSRYPSMRAWAEANPGAMDAIVTFINRVKNLDVRIVPNNTNRGQGQGLVDSGTLLMLGIPVMGDTPIPDASGTLGSATSTINEMLRQQRITKIVPVAAS